MRGVRPEDIAAFARRDWQGLARSKDAQWQDERRRRGVTWCFRIADDLRRQADLDTHIRVGKALRRVGRTGDQTWPACGALLRAPETAIGQADLLPSFEQQLRVVQRPG